MFTRPPEVSDADVAAAIEAVWSIDVSEVQYLAVGFGSHHWVATQEGRRWFVTLDDLEQRRRDESQTRTAAGESLAAALEVASTLEDAGLDFVIAPIRTRAGSVTHPIDDRYLVSLYSYIDGRTHTWGPFQTSSERWDVLDRIVAVHLTSRDLGEVGRHDDFVVPRRHALLKGHGDDESSWGPGPFSDEARLLIVEYTDWIQVQFGTYDRLVADVSRQRHRMVITHGEPHRANTISTPHGVVLIDWDTALRAVPERDLWSLIGEDPEISDAYTDRTGVRLDPSALSLYRMWWDLSEISLCAWALRQPHEDDEDARVNMAALRHQLDSVVS